MYKATVAAALGVVILSAALLSIPFVYSHLGAHSSPLAILHLSPPPTPLVNPSPVPFVCAAPNDPIRPHSLPCLISLTPADAAVGVTSAITLSFSQPMHRHSVETSFSLTPAAYGSLVWIDDSTLTFQPYRLPHATDYTVQVGGHSAFGQPLSGQTVWHFTTTAGPPLVLAPGPSSIRVPILMYHYIRNNPDPRDVLGFNLSVTPANFAAQMNWLDSQGYHTITLDDLSAYLNGTRGLPAHPIILSFDDGYADFYSAALPVLLTHDFTAVSYVVPGFWGDASRYMTPTQVLAADHYGIQIASHTVNHVNLTTASNASLNYQLTSSKASLESLLGHSVLSFCYPSGRFDSRVAAAVQNAGYRDATTTQGGSARALYSRYVWARTRISGGESLSTFAASIGAAS